MQISFKVPDQPLAYRTGSISGDATLPVPTTEGACPLLDLPLELRQQIWIEVLRPDCAASKHRQICEKEHQHPTSFLGCTRILRVCSQIYHETIEMLHREEKSLKLGFYSKFLRGPRENGKPGYYQGLKVATRCYVPRQYEELQVLHFRKLHLHIVFPEPIAFRLRNTYDGFIQDKIKGVYEVPMKKTVGNIERMANILGRNIHLKQLWLTFGRKSHSWAFENSVGGNTPLMPHPELLEKLQSLVTAITHVHCSLVAESREDAELEGEPEEPLAADIVSFAQRAGLTAQLKITPRPPTLADYVNAWLEDAPTPVSDASTTENGSYADEAGKADKLLPLPLPLPTILPGDRKLAYTCPQPYQLTPECRTCYALFPCWSALHHHLTTTHPHHCRTFRAKVWNELDRYALAGPAGRKCWTCARGFATLEGWKRHAKQKGHERKGVVPRWREDNRAWERMWREREGRLGWL